MLPFRRRMGAIGCALHVALVSSFLAVSSRAESVPTEKLEEARGWYRDGLSLEAAGDWARALARFERVAEVRLTPQVRFHVARCKEHLGRFTEALGEYRISEYEAERDGLVELAEITQARQSLEARVPKLELRRGTGAERAAVRLDGVELGQRAAQFGVDPGPHLVTATKPGWRDFEYAFVAEEGGRIVVEITLDALPVSPPDHRDAPSPAPEPAPLPREDGRRVWPLALSGTALLAAGAGTVFLVLRSRALETQEQYCTGSVCNEDFRGQVERAEAAEARNGTLAVVAFSASGLALLGATWLWLEEEPAQAHGGGLGWHATATDHDWTMGVGGRF